MIERFIELSKICDLKAIQEEAKYLNVTNINEVKKYFANNNIEISDKLANELLERLGTKEMSIDELSTVSAGTTYYDVTQDRCPVCGNETWYESTDSTNSFLKAHQALVCPDGKQFTICGTPYEIWICTKCCTKFTYWNNGGYLED